MRAARYDLLIETGAALVRSFSACTPGEPVPARVVGPGDRIYYKGQPLYVYARTAFTHPTDPSLNTVTFTFGTGAWYEPTATVPAEGLVYPALKATLLEAVAGFSEFIFPVVSPPIEPPPDPTCVPPVEVSHPLPVTLADQYTAVLDMPDTLTADMRDLEGSWSWDLYARTDAWSWVRLVEGTLSIVGGSGRAAP